jgi:hypothetical protein
MNLLPFRSPGFSTPLPGTPISSGVGRLGVPLGQPPPRQDSFFIRQGEEMVKGNAPSNCLTGRFSTGDPAKIIFLKLVLDTGIGLR